MMIRKLDFLSPTITFYYKGYLSHSSIISGILSILSFILIIVMAVYFSLELIEKKEPKSYYFNRFTNDSGIIQINSSGLFHFISMSQDQNGKIESGLDMRSFRVIGFQSFFALYEIERNISKFDHWLYGFCNNGTDTKGIEHLIDYEFFNKFACIRKYFNSSEEKYYETDDPKFVWPTLEHGTYHLENKMYTIVLERCKEDTVSLILGEGSHCNSDEKTYEILSQSGVRLYYINNYIDVLKKNPILKFFNKIENGLQLNKYPMNNMNFNPTNVKTHNGLILDNIEIVESYGFERNDVYTYDNGESNFFSLYSFYLKNNMNFYERSYKRIQDIISDIGGIYQFVIIVSTFINSFYNKYIVINNIENLLYSSIDLEKNNNKKMNDKDKKSRNKSKNIEKNNINEIKKNSDSRKLNEVKSKSFTKNNDITNSKSNNNFITEFGKKNSELKKIEMFENIKEKLIENNHKKFNFWNFIVHKLSCGNKNKSYEIYDTFRKKIISEEHLIKNHLNIYNLLRVNKKKRDFHRNSYQLKDLMKLV